jgi:adenylate kinase
VNEHVILMGPQGSGKGTQSHRVRSELALSSVATGELFRAAIKNQTELGTQIREIYDRGELIPDEMTIALVDERLDEIARESARAGRDPGHLYDGFPRTAAQAAALDILLERRGEGVTRVIAIDVPREALIKRLSGRRVCSVCGRVYNIESDPPRVPGRCDDDGGELVQRADDTAEAVEKRLDLYEAETAPLLDRYAERGLLVHVDGDRPIEEVTKSIRAAIQSGAPVRAGASGARR